MQHITPSSGWRKIALKKLKLTRERKKKVTAGNANAVTLYAPHFVVLLLQNLAVHFLFITGVITYTPMCQNLLPPPCGVNYQSESNHIQHSHLNLILFLYRAKMLR